MAEPQRSTGTVKWFSGQKGFGFIAPDDGGEDLFVHQTSIRSEGFRTLSEGEPVEFLIDLGEDGRTKAADVISLAGSRFPAGGRRGGRGGGRGRGDSYDEYGGSYGSYGGGGRGYGRGGRGGGRRGGRIGGGGSGVECYNCGRMGHLARDCYQSGGGGGGGNGRYGGGYGGGRGGYGGGRGGYTGGGGGGGRCYNCGEEGHFARDCPNEQK